MLEIGVGRLLKRAGRIVPAPVLGAREQAAAILSAAAARAEALIREGESSRAEARRQGYDEGRDAAAAALTQTLAAAALEAERVRAGTEPAAMRLASRLAAKMTERIVGHALELAPELMVDIAERALVSSRARTGVVRLRVHPDDLALLSRDDIRGRLCARLEARGVLQLEPDPAVGRHGCVVETAAVRLDARLETQIAALERALGAEAGP